MATAAAQAARAARAARGGDAWSRSRRCSLQLACLLFSFLSSLFCAVRLFLSLSPGSCCPSPFPLTPHPFALPPWRQAAVARPTSLSTFSAWAAWAAVAVAVAPAAARTRLSPLGASRVPPGWGCGPRCRRCSLVLRVGSPNLIVHCYSVKLEDLYNGATKKIKLRKKVLCGDCTG